MITKTLKPRSSAPLPLRIISESAALFVPLTVVLELEWVLRSFYEFERSDFMRVVEHLAGLPNVTLEDEPRIIQALSRYAEGLDFADALHWAGCRHCERFFTFDDRRFARRAKLLQIKPVVDVPTE
jgi:predicted nucleic-acid-binding protein